MRQRVAIARALACDSRILILDEPTAFLSIEDSDRLLACVTALAQGGAAILFVSHRMADVRRIADRYLILRDGVVTLSARAQEVSDNEVTQAMFGSTWMHRTAERGGQAALKSTGPPALVVSGATRRPEFSDISLTLRAGEITLLAGLTGSGRTEFAESLAGLRHLDRGNVQIFGKSFLPLGPRHAMRAGLIYVPEDRVRTGLFPKRSVSENFLSATDHLRSRYGFLRKETGIASQQITEYEIQCSGPRVSLQTLSGGNQQKVLLARWRMAQPRILILDEPTAGIDVAAKAGIHARLRQWADDGAALLVISSETEEVLALSDRVLVFHLGLLVMDRRRDEISPELLTRAMLHGNSEP
jgi:ABC-type sugar transport system ATPase subunit